LSALVVLLRGTARTACETHALELMSGIRATVEVLILTRIGRCKWKSASAIVTIG
jgi:hypothetical protein